jgi:outer membrane protein assembly factor BamD
MQNPTLPQLIALLVKKSFPLACILLISGCSFFGDRDEEQVGAGMIETELYEEASGLIESSQFSIAAQFLQALEAQFPFGLFAEQAQLDLIYAYFRGGQYDSATATADRFIRLHPEHPDVDYAYYMRGLISFNQESSFIGNFLPLDVTKRDPGSARESFSFFSEFLARFPNSEYAPDSRKRMIYLRNMLARHEINVANYYFDRGAFLAATNRGRYVIESFQGSPAVPDGLAVMAQGYTLLGKPELAENSIAVLRENYPEHPALDAEGNLRERDIVGGVKRSWLNRVTFGIVDQPDPLGFDTRAIYNPELQ